MKHATPVRFRAVRWGLLAALTAGLGLMQACGGRATGDVDGEGDEVTGQAGAAPLLPARSGGSSSTAPRAAAPPPRDGEVCYSRSRLADVPELQAVLPFLSDDPLDDNGCVASMYSNWVDGGGCNYDPRPAVVRGDRCCYLLNASLPGCD